MINTAIYLGSYVHLLIICPGRSIALKSLFRGFDTELNPYE